MGYANLNTEALIGKVTWEQKLNEMGKALRNLGRTFSAEDWPVQRP